MGVVYLGRDPVIGRMVALKTILAVGEDEVEQREFGERFLREAQAAGILSHPNIVTVHDVGEDTSSRTAFIAMEYVEGKNLKQLIQEKTAFTWERTAEIIGQVAEALDYAHRRGIVHRDVKPANIIITPEGGVKITDFGIAKIEHSNLTTEGQFLGTPNYMSPEQVTGEAVDGRSDLFSLGVVLYELLTRKKPFTADNLTSISFKIVHEPYSPPETWASNVPQEFGGILAKALSKDPADRYQRGNDFALALYEFKAREEERQMLRDLGNMVAEAENLGPMGAVDAPAKPIQAAPDQAPSGPVPAVTMPPEAGLTVPIIPPSLPTPPPQGAAPAAARPAPPTGPLQPLAAGAEMEGSAPDWTLDEPEREARYGAVPLPPPVVVPAPGRDPAAERTSPKAAPLDDVRPTVILPPSAIPSHQTPAASLENRPTEVIVDAARLASQGAPAGRPAPPVPGRPGTGPQVPAAPRPSPAAPAALPVPMLPSNLTEPLPPLPPPPAPRPEAPVKKAPASRFAVLVVGGTVLVAALVLGAVWARKSANERSVQATEEAKAKESAERADLMAEGNRLVGAGNFTAALQKYREVVRRDPSSSAARDAVAKTEQLLAEQEKGASKAAEVEARLAAAREADRAVDDAKAIEAAEAALALDPGNAEATSLAEAARGRIASRSAAEQKKSAEALKKKGKPTPVPVAAPAPAVATQQRPSREVVPPSPTPATAKVLISFASPIPDGHVMVSLNDKFIFRKTFNFGKKSGGGQVDGSAEVPSGRATFKVWVIATDGSMSKLTELATTIPGGETRTLRLELDAGKNLSVALR